GGPVYPRGLVLLDHARNDGRPLVARSAVFPRLSGAGLRPGRALLSQRMADEGALAAVLVGPAALACRRRVAADRRPHGPGAGGRVLAVAHAVRAGLVRGRAVGAALVVAGAGVSGVHGAAAVRDRGGAGSSPAPPGDGHEHLHVANL